MNNHKPLITFIAPAHNEPEYDRVFVTSMLAQTCQEFHAVVFNNGPDEEHIDSWIIDQNVGWSEEYSDHIQFKKSVTDSGNWGTKNRQTAIEECRTEYIIQTSISDYWLPQAVDIITKALQANPDSDILVWNSINHLIAPCRVLDAELAWSKLDWGNFAIRTSIAKEVGINHGHTYCADWNFITDCLNKGLIKKAIKLQDILTIHN
jgi:hypothetical protein